MDGELNMLFVSRFCCSYGSIFVHVACSRTNIQKSIQQLNKIFLLADTVPLRHAYTCVGDPLG